MSSGETALGAPRGMRDFYPEDMVLRNRIFDAWRRSAELFGFQPYDACVVESLDLLKRKAGEEIVEQIYAFKDKSGRDLALRPEMTPTLARMVTARHGSLSFPLKWSAVAQCFRYERMSKGRKREHFQWNLDILGEPAVTAEAEVIAAAVHALRLLGLENGSFHVHFSSRALLADILVRTGIPREQHATAFLAIDKRGKVPDEEIRRILLNGGMDEECVARAFGLLAISSIEECRKAIGEETPSLASIGAFGDILASYGLSDTVVFDLSVVRGLSYYTGIVFEAFDAKRKYRAIFGGGRYDNLLRETGGPQLSGVGLGFGDVVVGELLCDTGRFRPGEQRHGTAVAYMTDEQRACAISVATAMRKRDVVVSIGTRTEKPRDFFARAGGGMFAEAIYIGPDDITRGQVKIKDLASRSERLVAIADLVGGHA